MISSTSRESVKLNKSKFMQPVDHPPSYSPSCWVLGEYDAPRRLSTCSRPTASCTYYYFVPACPSTKRSTEGRDQNYCFVSPVAVAVLLVVSQHHHRAPSAWPFPST